jgi:hypothetical protein
MQCRFCNLVSSELESIPEKEGESVTDTDTDTDTIYGFTLWHEMNEKWKTLWETSTERYVSRVNWRKALSSCLKLACTELKAKFREVSRKELRHRSLFKQETISAGVFGVIDRIEESNSSTSSNNTRRDLHVRASLHKMWHSKIIFDQLEKKVTQILSEKQTDWRILLGDKKLSSSKVQLVKRVEKSDANFPFLSKWSEERSVNTHIRSVNTHIRSVGVFCLNKLWIRVVESQFFQREVTAK